MNVGAITLFIDDVARTKAFYVKTFGLEPVHEDDDAVTFKFDNTIVNLLREPEAAAMIAPATVGSGARLQLTIWVEDVDAEAAKLAVPLLNGPIDRPWGQRTVAFADPDGHIWELAQTI